MARRSFGVLGVVALAALACGSGDSEEPGEVPAAAPPEAAAKAPSPPATPDSLPTGLVLSLSQFTKTEKYVAGAARLEFLYRDQGAWRMTALEDPESNAFHKAMAYQGAQGLRLLTLGGTAAIVKTWEKRDNALEGTTVWKRHFSDKSSRMRDAEVADLYGDGAASIAVATHDQGIVAVLRPSRRGFSVVQLDAQPDTFVHEIEIGDLDGDGKLEVYATPSRPNRVDGTPQPGQVVRYVPVAGKGRVVVAELGDRHAKEILVDDVDRDGRDELYVAVEGHQNEAKELVHPVQIRRYDAGTPPAEGRLIATIQDRFTRFLCVGDVDGDGRNEMVAAAGLTSGLWLLRPGRDDPKAAWSVERIDKYSAGYEHATLLTDLDGDGTVELYVASDRHREVRRYIWDGRARAFAREVIYVRQPDDRTIVTWNLTPVPRELIPGL